MQTFMRYVIARYEEIQRDAAYRIYCTDAMRLEISMIAQLGGSKSFEIPRWYDVAYGQKAQKETRTSAEIIDTIKGKLAKVGGES